MRRLGKIGVYGSKTRQMQRRLSFEAFGLSFKQAYVFLYQGSSQGVISEIDDIQTTIFSEVPDRAYASEPIGIPIGMDPMNESPMDFSRFGILSPMTEEHTFRVHIDDYHPLGRKIMIGDVFWLPFYDTDNHKSYWEVTDVDEKPQAENFTNTITATPLVKSRATKEINVDDTNDDFLTSMMDDFDDEVFDDVVNKEPSYESKPKQEEEADYRNKQQRDFLDDMTIDF